MQFAVPEAKGSRCPAPQTAGQRRGWRRAELGFLEPRSSLATPVFSRDLNGYVGSGPERQAKVDRKDGQGYDRN